jgi:type II secretory pathway pseudopilin PulG
VGEQGWALLGLLLALGIMSIVLSSSIIPNVQMQVQRAKRDRNDVSWPADVGRHRPLV